MFYKSVKIKSLFLAMGLVLTLPLTANVSLPSIFGNHMVMQQQAEVKLWGWGKPLENIAVKPSWSADTLKTVVNNYGKWSVMLHTPEAGGSHQIHIQGYNTVTIEDILMGEVWLLSGQSNMEWTTRFGIVGGDEAAKNAENNEIRLFNVTLRTSPYKCIDVKGEWVKCTTETMYDFSAIGYFFGDKLNKELNVPVGLISSNWGGTPIESWIPDTEIYASEKLDDASHKIPYFPWAPSKPGVTYNAMIAPIMPFTIKGVLWYQGEANVENAYAYTDFLELLVSNWRKGFHTDFDFYYAQIAPYRDYGGEQGVQIRDAQRRALQCIDHSGMMVVSDIGDTVDIHPRRKIEAGQRFADLALNKTYGKRNFPVSGPLFKSYIIKGNTIEVSFDYNEGLYCKEGDLQWFEVAGEDMKWHKAKAEIKADKIYVSSKKVKKPLQVRFAWHNAATPNLFNKYDLPASCFTTENWMSK